MVNKTFEKLVRDNTREEFNQKYKVVDLRDCDEECFVLLDVINDYELDCPWIKDCPINDDCEQCWKNAIKQSKFKDEVG